MVELPRALRHVVVQCADTPPLPLVRQELQDSSPGWQQHCAGQEGAMPAHQQACVRHSGHVRQERCTHR
jgi:hypothetical protein